MQRDSVRSNAESHASAKPVPSQCVVYIYMYVEIDGRKPVRFLFVVIIIATANAAMLVSFVLW